MTSEKLCDALGFLDDDIIEETNRLRCKKSKGKRAIISAVSIAACLCIGFFALHGVMNSELAVGIDGVGKVPAEDATFSADGYYWAGFGTMPDRGEDITAPNKGAGGVMLPEVSETLTLYGYNYIESPKDSESVWCYATIIKWCEGYFYARITGSECEGVTLSEGDIVRVRCLNSNPENMESLEGESILIEQYELNEIDDDLADYELVANGFLVKK